MREEQIYRRINWDWIFALPFIIIMLYIFL